ncbi:hypothetical protein Q1695_003301 [Nippostrongylus brasiliensis]|nr:hypothetical protein Q1695_003301 [Nippostrongylus brasiliensis]
MNFHMYREYQVKELVEETMRSVVEAACSYDSDRTTVVDYSAEDDTREELRFSLEESEGSESDYSESGLSLEVHDLARAHWIQLHKLNRQSNLIQNALLYIVENYKHTRPIWQFGLGIDESTKDWKTLLFNNFYFRHHSASIQAAVTMVMENMDDRDCMKKLLNEIGAHHFFYDACEPHLELFEQGMIHSLRTTLVGHVKIDESTEQSWTLFLKDLKTFMGEGIAIQRNTYLRDCMTEPEITEIRSKWSKVEEFGLQEAGQVVCERGIRTYTTLITSHKMDLVIPFRPTTDVFTRFAAMTMKAFDVAIKSHSETVGFCNLVTEIKEFVVTCIVLEMCPTFARKAMTEGMFAMLTKVFGEQELDEFTTRIWGKLYRALEQAIIANIVDY